MLCRACLSLPFRSLTAERLRSSTKYDQGALFFSLSWGDFSRFPLQRRPAPGVFPFSFAESSDLLQKESFNGKLRDELLDRELFATLLEAKVLVEQYRKNYNEHRPHSALGYLAPSVFAATYPQQINHEPALALT